MTPKSQILISLEDKNMELKPSLFGESRLNLNDFYFLNLFEYTLKILVAWKILVLLALASV